MKVMVKHLWLAVALIAVASSILLLSDTQQRRGAKLAHKRSCPIISIMQHVSVLIIDSHVEGVLSRLDERGYVAPGRTNIRFYNAHGDYPTATAIARDIVSGPSDIMISSSTLSLQALARANENGSKIHVFGAVTDPYGTGVGISGPEPEQHPPYLVGIGTFQPVENTFRIAKEMNPALQRVGTVWNPGEQCSEACVKKARAICTELGMTLVEVNASNTSEIPEALRAVIAKDVDAIWIGGDTVAMAAVDLIARQAQQAGIAAFTNSPADVERGMLFGLGADYFQVGEYTAEVAVAILGGADPAEFRIDNAIPERLRVNYTVLAGLSANWSLTPTLQQRLVGAELQKEKNLTSKTGEAPAELALVNLTNNASLDAAIEGVWEGLAQMGLQQGKDYAVRIYNAQGDMTQMSQILDQVAQQQPDMLITVSTPVFVAAAKRNFNFPLVFTVASDPVKLGLFQHGCPPNITGVHDDPPLGELLQMARRYDPALTAVGIVYDPGQMNSILSVEKLRRAGQEQNVTIHEATVATISDLPMATQALIQRGARAIIISADNLAVTGFAAIHKVAAGADIPIFTTNTSLMQHGASGAVGDSYLDWGCQSGQLAARVLAGVSPADIPIRATQVYDHIEPEPK